MEAHREIFSKVTASLDKMWKEYHHENICDILKAAEEHSEVDITFVKGVYQFTGTFEEIRKAHQTLTNWPLPGHGARAGGICSDQHCVDVDKEFCQKNDKLSSDVECSSARHSLPSETLRPFCCTEERPLLEPSSRLEEAPRGDILVDQNLWNYFDRSDVSDKLQQLGDTLGVKIHQGEQKFQTIRLEPKERDNRVDEAYDSVILLVKDELQEKISHNSCTTEKQETDGRTSDICKLRPVQATCEEGTGINVVRNVSDQEVVHQTAHVLISGPRLDDMNRVLKKVTNFTPLADTSTSENAERCCRKAETSQICDSGANGSRERTEQVDKPIINTKTADVKKESLYDRETDDCGKN